MKVCSGYAKVVLSGCILFATVCCGCDGARGQDGAYLAVVKKIDKALSAKSIAKVAAGLKIVCLNDGEVVYQKNASKAFSVASNMKVATTAAALVLLGRDYEFRTRLMRGGTLQSGTLKGDLLVIGSGDPNISGRFYGSPTAVFESWAKMLSAQGVGRVEGDILLDDTFFDRAFVPDTWPKGQLHLWYCAPVSALSLNDNCIDVTVSPTSEGSLVQFSLSPPTNYVTVKNTCTTTSKKAEHSVNLARKLGTTEVILSGKYFSGSSPQTFFVTVDNPPLFFGTVLKETLARCGITVTGSVKLLSSPPTESSFVPVAVHSQSLQTVISTTNKNSQNLFAEIILKTLGKKISGAGTWAGGVKAMEKFFTQVGIPKDQFNIADGCGLSDESKLSPDALVKILAFMSKSSYASEFRESLAIAGQDGTLERRFSEEAYKGRVFAKTGYIRGTSALSGYAKSASGKIFAFSIIFNNAAAVSNTNMKAVQDEIVKALLVE